jgi:hypothetical protein
MIKSKTFKVWHLPAIGALLLVILQLIPEAPKPGYHSPEMESAAESLILVKP